MVNPVDWLSEREPYYESMKPADKKAATDFFTIWSYFESEVLDCRACLGNFEELAKALVAKDGFRSISLNEMVSYLQSRYIVDGQTNGRYEQLNLSQSKNLVSVIQEMLLDGNCQDFKKFIGCLGVVYRFRNNLFHGPKWLYFLKEQKENMEMSCQFMIETMDSVPNNRMQ